MNWPWALEILAKGLSNSIQRSEGRTQGASDGMGEPKCLVLSIKPSYLPCTLILISSNQICAILFKVSLWKKKKHYLLCSIAFRIGFYYYFVLNSFTIKTALKIAAQILIFNKLWNINQGCKRWNLNYHWTVPLIQLIVNHNVSGES